MDDKLLAALASRCDYIPCEIGVCPYHTAIAELSRLEAETERLRAELDVAVLMLTHANDDPVETGRVRDHIGREAARG